MPIDKKQSIVTTMHLNSVFGQPTEEQLLQEGLGDIDATHRAEELGTSKVVQILDDEPTPSLSETKRVTAMVKSGKINFVNTGDASTLESSTEKAKAAEFFNLLNMKISQFEKHLSEETVQASNDQKRRTCCGKKIGHPELLAFAILCWICAFGFMGGLIYVTNRDDTEGVPRSAIDQNLSQWSYIGWTSPPDWVYVSLDYIPCKNGTLQSPIDINPLLLNVEKEDPAIPLNELFQYPTNTSLRTEINEGLSPYYVCTAECGRFSFDGQIYELDHIIFHTHSEHSYLGNFLPLELQFYHTLISESTRDIIEITENGRDVRQFVEQPPAILAFSVLFISNESYGFPINGSDYNSTWANTETGFLVQQIFNESGILENNVKIGVEFTVDLNPFQIGKYFTYYIGSITVPPCTEPVTWIVQSALAQVSGSLVNALFNTVGYPGNFRNIQPKGSRVYIQYDPNLGTVE